MVDVVTSATVEASLNADGYQQGAQKIVTSSDAAASAADRLSASIEKAGSNSTLTAGGFQKFWASLDSNVSRAQQYQNALDKLNAYQTAGVASSAEFALAQEALARKYSDLGAATDAAAVKTNQFASVLGFAREAAAAFGLVLGVQAIVQFGEKVFGTAAALEDQAKQVGVTVEQLQAYRIIMANAGIATSEADTLIMRFVKTLGEAKEGSSTALAAFEKLGISQQQIISSSPQQMMQATAAALENMGGTAQAAADETAIFGRSGQQLGAALSGLSQNIDTVTARLKAAGYLIGNDTSEAADRAEKSLAALGDRMEAAVAPAVVAVADDVARLAGMLNRLSGVKLNGFWTSVESGAIAVEKVLSPVIGTLSNLHDLIQKLPAPSAPVTGDTTADYIAKNLPLNQQAADELAAQQKRNDAEDEYLKKLQTEVDLGKLSGAERAQELAVIQMAEQVTGRQNLSYKDALGLIDASAVDHARILGLQKYQTDEMAKQQGHLEKLAGLYDQFLAKLAQGVQQATLSTIEQQKQLAVIQAADALQKERGVTEAKLVATYQDAVAVLGAASAQFIAQQVAAKAANQIIEQQNEQLDRLNAGLGVSKDQRDLILKDVEDEQKAGIAIGSALDDQIKKNNTLIQQKQDLTNYADYIASLEDEVRLAGLTTDERQKQQAILQEMHATHGTLTQDQAREIAQLIEARQEAEKWAQQIDQAKNNLEQGFQSAFANMIETGKGGFKDLVDVIKQQFANLLAWMAVQAIEQPIIVPMIQSMTGAVGGLGSLLGTGAGGSPIYTGLAGMPVMGGTSPLGSLLGGTSLFGTSLGSILGSGLLGLGIGGIASSLTGGNSLGGGLGGLLGGVAGNFILPGIGGLLGSALGGLVGGLFGPSTPPGHNANISFGANFTAGTPFGSEMNATTQGYAAQLGSSLQTILQALTSAGVKLDDTIKMLTISASHQSVLTTTTGQEIKIGAPGDVNAAISGTLNYLLSTAKITDSNVAKVLSYYQQNGGITASNAQQAAADIQFAESLKNLSYFSKSLDTIHTDLKQIADQAKADAAHAKSLGLGTSAVTDAQQAAVAALGEQFSKNIASQITAITDPVAAAVNQLVAQQKQNLSDAKALGLDLDRVNRLNAEQAKALVDNYLAPIKSISANLQPLDDYRNTLKQINQAEAQASEAANKLGLSLDGVTAAADKARAGLAEKFNKDIASQLLKITDPVKSAIDDLFATERQRIQDARAVGGNIGAAERLNAAERSQAFQSYLDPFLQYTNAGRPNYLQALDQINAAEKAAIEAAKLLGQSVQKVRDDAQAARDALAKTTISQAMSPIDQVLKSLRPSDTWAADLKTISDAEKSAEQAARKFGESLDAIQTKADKARERLAAAFNKSIDQQLLAITDPILAQYDTMIDAQKKRMEDAKKLGADLTKVQALNDAELEKFLIGLTPEQRAKLEQELNLSGPVIDLANALGDLNNALGDGIAAAQAAAQAAQKTADDWTNAQDALTNAGKAILVSTNLGLSPQTVYQNSRSQFDQLLQAALGGDVTAANNLSSFASQFLQSSLAYNAATPQYAADFDYVQKALADAAAAAGTQASLAQQQADAAKQTVSLLQTIQQQIETGAPNIDVLKAQLDQMGTSVDALQQISGISADQLTALAKLNDTMNAVLGKLGGHNALGGLQQPGMSYLVGERGPEIFTSPGGTVTPLPALPAAANSNQRAVVAALERMHDRLGAALDHVGGSIIDVTDRLERLERAVVDGTGATTDQVKILVGETRHATTSSMLSKKVGRAA